jgi:large subunit ribosomal protein L28
MRATSRRFNANVQKVRILANGITPVQAYVCTRCLKAGKVLKAP